MKIDYHIHTVYSNDSRIKAEDLIHKAILLKYDAIAITEHLDLLPYELSDFGIPSFRKYERHIKALRDRFTDSPLKIICGAEIGDYHRVQDYALEFISHLELELILGAVHFTSDHTNVAIPMRSPLDKARVEDYYRQNLELVQTCDINILAHLGVYKRYYTEVPDESHCNSIIADIFRVMIDRGIVLEINYSAFRKPYQRLLPELHHIEIYRELGGELFSVGSDSHLLEHFDECYDKLPGWLFDGSVRFPIVK